MPTPVGHVWRPSNARVVVLDDFIPVPRGSKSPTPVALSWPAKDPSDILDYILDLSAAFVGNDGDGITEIDVAIAPDKPGDLTLKSVIADGVAVILWLSSGQPATDYTVTVSIITGTGRCLSRSVLLPVRTLAHFATPPGAIGTENGTLIVDQYGSPVVAI